MEVKDTQLLYPEKEKMTVKITVFEGIQYHVGKIEIEGETLFTEAQIRAQLKMGEGAVFSPKGLKPTDPSLELDQKNIKDLYGRRGYIDCEIKPVRLPNVENAKIDLDYKIVEGAQSFVDRIIIQGNNRTKDKVLRREIPLAPGDIYDSVRVDAAKKKLENMGYFEKVDISPQETSVPNRRNMVVTVEEKRTGSVTFGVGFSSVDSLLGFVELSQGNFDIANWPYFTGAGQKFRTPHPVRPGAQGLHPLLHRALVPRPAALVGFDIFAHQFSTDYESSDYAEWDVGFDARVAKQLTPFWTASAVYKLEEVSLYDFDDYVKQNLPGLLAERGNRSESSVSGSLTYDTRDSVFLTRRGEKVGFTVMGAGGPLLGQTNIYKLQLDAQKFFSLPGDLIFSMKPVDRVANNYGDSNEVPLFERYFVGGSRSVRGFDERLVGPVYPNSSEPTGGRTYGYTNFELTGPIIDRVRWAVFYDAGFVDSAFGAYGDVPPRLQLGGRHRPAPQPADRARCASTTRCPSRTIPGTRTPGNSTLTSATSSNIIYPTLMKKTLLALFFGLIALSGAHAQTKIAVIDLQSVFNNYYKTKDAESVLKERAAAFDKEKNEMTSDYQKMVEDAQKLHDASEGQDPFRPGPPGQGQGARRQGPGPPQQGVPDARVQQRPPEGVSRTSSSGCAAASSTRSTSSSATSAPRKSTP